MNKLKGKKNTHSNKLLDKSVCVCVFFFKVKPLFK